MLLIEYCIKLPITIDKYQIAHLYTTMEMSKEYTTGPDVTHRDQSAVQILENTPCDHANIPQNKQSTSVTHIQRTLKQYKIPDSLISSIGLIDCVLSESSFNGFPVMRTTVTAAAGASCEYTIDTLCKPFTDSIVSNMFKLPQLIMDKCVTIDLDIVNDALPPGLVREDEDPCKVLGMKNDWQNSLTPANSMIVYKLMMCHANDSISDLVKDTMRNLLIIFHRKLICSQDKWNALTMEDIRTMEAETKKELDNIHL